MTSTSPDLLSVVLHLQPLELPTDRTLPRWWGRASHALLLRAIATIDPLLAERLHQPTELPRPFTASTLMGPRSRTGLDAQATYRLRFTTYQTEMTSVLQKALSPGGPLASDAIVELDQVAFRVLPSAGELTAWEARATYNDLASPWLTAQKTPSRTWTLLLASPTTFRSGGHHVPFPLPGLTFNSLLQRWNAYAPIVLPPETRRFASEAIAVTRYNLQTRSIPLKAGGLRIGAVGEVTYRALPYDRYWMSVIQTLVAFARFAGIGAGTTMGLGQARWKPPASSQSTHPPESE